MKKNQLTIQYAANLVYINQNTTFKDVIPAKIQMLKIVIIITTMLLMKLKITFTEFKFN